MTQNQIAYWNYRETNRSNVARETETNRANKVREAQTWRQIKDNWWINFYRQAETNRQNRVSEKQRDVVNAETERRNRKAEEIQLKQIETDKSKIKTTAKQIAETKRSNLADEQIRREQNVITSLRDQRNYAVQSYSAVQDMKNRSLALAETTRHNIQQESLSSYQNFTNRIVADNNRRLGWAQFDETRRNNLANNALTREAHAVQLVSATLNAVSRSFGRSALSMKRSK